MALAGWVRAAICQATGSQPSWNGSAARIHSAPRSPSGLTKSRVLWAVGQLVQPAPVRVVLIWSARAPSSPARWRGVTQYPGSGEWGTCGVRGASGGTRGGLLVVATGAGYPASPAHGCIDRLLPGELDGDIRRKMAQLLTVVGDEDHRASVLVPSSDDVGDPVGHGEERVDGQPQHGVAVAGGQADRRTGGRGTRRPSSPACAGPRHSPCGKERGPKEEQLSDVAFPGRRLH